MRNLLRTAWWPHVSPVLYTFLWESFLGIEDVQGMHSVRVCSSARAFANLLIKMKHLE